MRIPPLFPGLMCAATALVGCAPSRPLPVTVEVRTAQTHAPVQGARIRGMGTTLFLPLWQKTASIEPGAALGPSPNPAATQGTTDVKGIARVTLAGDRPNQLVIRADGCAPIQLLVEAGTARVHMPDGWSSGGAPPETTPQDGKVRIEARVRAAGKP